MKKSLYVANIIGAIEFRLTAYLGGLRINFSDKPDYDTAYHRKSIKKGRNYLRLSRWTGNNYEDLLYGYAAVARLVRVNHDL